VCGGATIAVSGEFCVVDVCDTNTKIILFTKQNSTVDWGIFPHGRAVGGWNLYNGIPSQGNISVCITPATKLFFETLEERKDHAEWIGLCRAAPAPMHAAPNTPNPQWWEDDPMDDLPHTPVQLKTKDDHEEDNRFEKYLQKLRKQGSHFDADDLPNNAEFFNKPDDASEVPDETAEHVSEVPRYLDEETSVPHLEEPETPRPSQMPRTDFLNNSYLRVLHTNGIHHLAMVCCRCRGSDEVPLDLLACRLVPTSFHTFRTLFTSPLLDYFRLCNLELKASAYQFYQLLRRLSSPIAPAEVMNLYNEFRRMSRLWRWMKKLKWQWPNVKRKDPMGISDGVLAMYCPACPQPGINLPVDWKSDPNRYVIYLRLSPF
jgi:hypothetical protein